MPLPSRPFPPIQDLAIDDDERHEDEVDHLPFVETEPESDHANEDIPRLRAKIKRDGGGPRARTRRCRRILNQKSDVEKARLYTKLIDDMADQGVDIVTFLDDLSWGLDVPAWMTHESAVLRCVALNMYANIKAYTTVRYARSSLMHSEELPGILKRWHKPPRDHDRGISTRGGRDALNAWAMSNVIARINGELRQTAELFASPPEEMTEKQLLAIDLQEDVEAMKTRMPTFWEIMHSMSCTPRQKKENKYKDHEPVSLRLSR